MESILPLDVPAGLFLDPRKAERIGQSYRQTYVSPQPFPHIVLDGLIPEAMVEELAENFPS